jgi:hypothetical protein
MTSGRVSIRPINDVRPIGGFTNFERGSELLVHATTAAALVLSGTAIQLPLPPTPYDLPTATSLFR